MTAREQRKLRTSLLAWYDANRRHLPWRAAPDAPRTDPYRVWLSEIMLQQTTVITVGPYYEDFLKRWPTVGALAAAPLDDVLHACQGLGYYARARNLHKCAQVVANDLKGRFPDCEEALRKLPGIGAYTAAAIAAIAFDRQTLPVDGNVIRVLSRHQALSTPYPKVKEPVGDYARTLAPTRRAGDFAQGLMDLGATVCTPRAPQCTACPWAASCKAFKSGKAEKFPVKALKKAKPVRHGIAFWIERGDGAVLLRRRPESGLLGGMMEVPSTDWRGEAWTLKEAAPQAPVESVWRQLPGTVRHTFTHFHLELTVVSGGINGRAVIGETDHAGGKTVWSLPENLPDYALPTIMKKIVRHAQESLTNT